MGEIFISYARKDRRIADKLSAELHRRGIEVWIDCDDIGGGDAWRAAISNAIRNCDAFLVLLTPRAVTSRNVAKELALAERHKRRIIPVMYEACEIPAGIDYQLMDLHWVDFAEEDAMEKLERALLPKEQRDAAQPVPQPDTSAVPAPTNPFPPKQAHRALRDILPGEWQIQVTNLANGIVAQIRLRLDRDGMFSGQITAALVTMNLKGEWECNVPDQIMLVGKQSDGFLAIPYQTVIQFTRIEPDELSGVTGAGKIVAWERIG